MLTALVAVLGTLLGSFVTGALQVRQTRVAQDGTRAEQVRRDRLQAVTDLAAVVSDHRRAMWTRESARLGAAPAERVQQLRDASHDTRAAITRPYVTLQVLIPHPDVVAAAHEAVSRAYALREAADPATLDAAREAAKEAHDAFVTASADFLAVAA
ncbi:hypothetical protein [Streptomyces niveus]|uniref:hypothetical protein n=1 Tax=Streptomyces niveus TaxID=193462 RepID=UPI0003C6106D|nr:hypothetical protein [Streptomyces niveus]EST17888.1 hypothetical protein M877_39970 [Streptomyces niveus NCIMB 11891]